MKKHVRSNSSKTSPHKGSSPDKKKEIIVNNVDQMDPIYDQPKFYFEIFEDVLFYHEEEYFDLIDSFIQNIQCLFKLKKQTCINYLQINGYDFSQTMKALSQDEHLFPKVPEFFVLTLLKKMSSYKDKSEELCLICSELVTKDSFYSLECGHQFCINCYKEYLHSLMIEKGFSCFPAKCPNEGCDKLVDIDDFEEVFMNEKNSLKKLLKLIKLYYRNSQPNHIKHCPKPNCPYIYKLPLIANDCNIKIVCPNDHSFCHKCGLSSHLPLNCVEYRLWFLSGKNPDHQDLTWITKHCKKCPKCGWDIQKNEGCNHMTCRLCNHEFCWLCFQDYHGHNGNLCNKLASKKKEQKTMKVKCMVNFNKKEILSKNESEFFEKIKKEEMLIKKRDRSEFKDKMLKLTQELDEFKFFSSKIAFIYPCDEKQEAKLSHIISNIDNRRTNIRNKMSFEKNFIKLKNETKTLFWKFLSDIEEFLTIYRKDNYFIEYLKGSYSN